MNYSPDILNCLANLSSDEVFTSPELANRMLDLLPQELFRSSKTRFLDPCSKSGVFLREIAKRLLAGLEEQIPDLQQRIDHIMTKQVFGIACTDLTAEMSRRTLYCTKLANGKYSVSTAFHDVQGNLRYDRCRHTWNAQGRCEHCGASQGEYLRADTRETYAYPFIHKPIKEIFKKDMQFDVIIGNPPYQMSDGGNGASAKPIYNLFVEQSLKLKPNYLVMITPSRWFAGGKGLDDYRNKMLSDKHIKVLVDYANAKDCFPNNSIGGGVSYFLWDASWNGKCNVININGESRNETTRSLNEYPVFIRFNDAINIVNKVKSFRQETIEGIISTRNPFGLSSKERGHGEKKEGDVNIITSQGSFFIGEKEVLQSKNLIDKYKVLISKVTSEHAGEPDKEGKYKVLSRTEVIGPNVVCTDSYIIIGGFNRSEEATNLYSYLTTRFVRFMLLMAVSSINLSKDKFQFVPLQDFSHPWTDEMLYEKYGLDKDEIAFIERMIRPME
ncbi:MAG: Eco57I restriction-modification methylase domain-containing protein [Bacteroidales bacterium]|nr:Eco57I restriction-modification methylase domain-containing protein [Bacteroidales bacterium]